MRSLSVIVRAIKYSFSPSDIFVQALNKDLSLIDLGKEID